MIYESDYDFSFLTPKQVKALPLLAIGCSAVEVSKKIKISQVQLSEWKRDPNFMSAINLVRSKAITEAGDALTVLAIDAVNILKDLMNNASSEQTKLRAALYVIDRFDYQSTNDLMEIKNSGNVDMNLLLASLGLNKGIIK